MMKLFLISVVFFFFVQATSSDMHGNSRLEKEVTTSGITSLHSSGRSTILQEENHWRDIYFLMMNVFSPSRPMDIPVDSHENPLSYKILHVFLGNGELDVCKSVYASSFMRLLFARHVNGFYIYFLRKLII